MKLVTTIEDHVFEMMNWFPDLDSVRIWGGPMIRFPLSDQSFTDDCCWQELPSYSLLGETGELLGFGQYYLRENHCHLGRLVIAPEHRGKGMAGYLICGLSQVGCEFFNVTACSLFVRYDNDSAIDCYRKLGFKKARYPDAQMDLEDCIYMITNLTEIKSAGRLPLIEPKCI